MELPSTQNNHTNLLVFLCFFYLGFPVLGQVSPHQRTEGVSSYWPEISQTAKPWTRWWWMGNAIDKANINHLLDEYANAGLGGLEIAPIYGAKGFEDRFVAYLSPEWLDLLHHTVAEAASHQMGIDLTQGTGWPFGGPWVKPEMAAQRMIVQAYSWNGKTLDRPVKMEDRRAERVAYNVAHVMAYAENGQATEITHTLQSDGSLKWNGDANQNVLVVYLAQTGQQVKRAAPGGQGFTLDHYSRESVKAYLARFEEAFSDNTPPIRAFYNDSFEVYGSDFTEGFFDYFQKKRGYDLKHHLPTLLAPDSTEVGIRLKSDYRETISDMLLENFTQQWTDWAHSHGKQTKNQAHGSPGNLLDLYATVDIPEGETFGSSYFPIPGLRRDSADIRNVDPDPIMLKFASSAAHLSGKNLVSSETFTWLGEHFKSSYSQAKPELEQAFLAGINHMFYHGVTYSPKELAFPGWLFYASLNLTTHNSLWAHFRGFNDFIARSQAVLQQGMPSHEILMYWPIYDVWADPKGLSKMITVHNIDEWLHPTPFYQSSKQLMEEGYSVDFVSDALLKSLRVEDGQLALEGGSRAQVILVPKLTYMRPETLETLMELAENGARIIFQEKPQDAPGYHQAAEQKARLEQLWASISFRTATPGVWVATHGQGLILTSGDFHNALTYTAVERESLTDSGLKFIRRISGKEAYYYLVNHTADTIDEWLPLNHRGQVAIILDPQQGATGKAASREEGNQWKVRVQLAAGESQVVRVMPSNTASINPWSYRNEMERSQTLTGPWQVSFVSGGPVMPNNRRIETIRPWTTWGDERNQSFSGLGAYETTFELQDVSEKVLILNLGTVHESAKVWINGNEVGYVYGLPFRIDISDHVVAGENSLKVEVANLMANRIRHMDQQGEQWRNYHEINFVNIDYKPFDASSWEVMPSGIKGPVTIEIYR